MVEFSKRTHIFDVSKNKAAIVDFAKEKGKRSPEKKDAKLVFAFVVGLVILLSNGKKYDF